MAESRPKRLVAFWCPAKTNQQEPPSSLSYLEMVAQLQWKALPHQMVHQVDYSTALNEAVVATAPCVGLLPEKKTPPMGYTFPVGLEPAGFWSSSGASPFGQGARWKI